MGGKELNLEIGSPWQSSLMDPIILLMESCSPSLLHVLEESGLLSRTCQCLSTLSPGWQLQELNFVRREMRPWLSVETKKIKNELLYFILLYYIVLCYTILYCKVRYLTVLYCTVLYCSVQYSTLRYCNVLFCTLLQFYYTF